MVSTKLFKISGKKILSLLFMQYGIPWIALSLTGVICFLVLGFCIDLRFFLLALIWLFLVMPLMMAFLYFFYGMKPLIAFNSLPHFLEFSDTHITISLQEKDDKKNQNEEESNKELSFKKYEISYEHFKGLKTGEGYVLLLFNEGFLCLPGNVFENRQEFLNVLENLPYNGS